MKWMLTFCLQRHDDDGVGDDDGDTDDGASDDVQHHSGFPSCVYSVLPIADSCAPFARNSTLDTRIPNAGASL